MRVRPLELRSQSQLDFLWDLRSLDADSDEKEIRAILARLQNPQGKGEIARQAKLRHIPVFDIYFESRSKAEYLGEAVLDRAIPIGVAERSLFSKLVIDLEKLSQFRNALEGDVRFSAIDPINERRAQGELFRIAPSEFAVPRGSDHGNVLGEIMKVKAHLREQCETLFAAVARELSGKEGWFDKVLRPSRRTQLNDLPRTLQNHCREVEGTAAMLLAKTYGSLLDESTPPSPEMIAKRFKSLDSSIKSTRVRIVEVLKVRIG